MAERQFWKRFLETKWLGLVLGLVVFAVVAALNFGTMIIKNLELKILDFNFRLKEQVDRKLIQTGVSLVHRKIEISPDILIVGVDERSLERFGRWPFPRYREADLADAFSRIRNQEERERALFFDIFFTEPDALAPENDVALVDSISASGRVFLETVLYNESSIEGSDPDRFVSQAVLSRNYGELTKVVGDWTSVETFVGMKPPLKPYAEATAGYGHPNFLPDADEVYRRVPLVAKVAEPIGEIPLGELTPELAIDRSAFERLAWEDKEGQFHDVPHPLTAEVIEELTRQMQRSAPPSREDTDNDGTVDREYFVVRMYRDHFMPAVSLSLALEYMRKRPVDVEVVVGQYVRIPSPQRYDPETGQWKPYWVVTRFAEYDGEGNETRAEERRALSELRIPIDDRGRMLVNFMGNRSSADPQGEQTFPVRSFSGYASAVPPADPAKWPATKKVANTIVMVGAFSQGIAQDEKTTPYGLMFGVEIHANALNTILMDNFLRDPEPWVSVLVLFGVIMLTAFMTSRLSTVWSLVTLVGTLVVYFFVVLVVFELNALILNLSGPAAGSFLCLLTVIAYRTVFEERDKRRIRSMFSKYVSPAVVDEILTNPPELGGVDKELTVFFSDIRGFTTLAESMRSSQELVNHLNAYFTAMTDLILDYQGTLDKYIGDEIMCFWGAPLPQPDHALLACKCALKQMEVLAQLNEAWPPERRLEIGIGINTGPMTVGNMGSLGRMNYTLMGDEVNIGARLEGTNKTYLTHVIISESTYAHVKDKVVARELDTMRVKGKDRAVVIYELVDVIEGLAPPKPSKAKGRILAAAAGGAGRGS